MLETPNALSAHGPSLVASKTKIREPENIFLKLPERMILTANLDRIDMMLIHECEKSDKVEDKLLALETIVRRANEHRHIY